MSTGWLGIMYGAMETIDGTCTRRKEPKRLGG